MPRYEEMDDLLQRVRDRLVDLPGETETAPSREESASSWDVVPAEEQYDRVLACTQGLLRDAELLRELLGADYLDTLNAAQFEHILSVLNSVMQELWSSEVSLRRAELHD